jgi:eukaryotic-like serine/threonine-protein kinase
MRFAQRYEVLGELGSGGYGQVLLARDHNQGQQVALKLFGRGNAPALAFREAHVLTALQGDHILRVLNADVYQDVPYIATKVASNRSAADWIASGRGLRPDIAVTWIRHMLKGLTVCHSAGLLHRDVKPHNLFIEREDLALLGDFGVVERQDDAGQAPMHGTPRFVAPEGITTGTLSVKSDVYSAGLTAWTLLTGQLPFASIEERELQQEIPRGLRQRLRDVAPSVPRSLALVVERAIRVDPASRFDTAMAMDRALGRLPVFACLWVEVDPPPRSERAWVCERRQLRVTVDRRGSRSLQITTAHIKSGRRLSKFCLVTTDARLSKELRSIFDNA